MDERAGLADPGGEVHVVEPAGQGGHARSRTVIALAASSDVPELAAALAAELTAALAAELAAELAAAWCRPSAVTSLSPSAQRFTSGQCRPPGERFPAAKMT